MRWGLIVTDRREVPVWAIMWDELLRRCAPTRGGFCPEWWQQGRGGSAVQDGRGERLPVAQTRWTDTQVPWAQNRSQTGVGGLAAPCHRACGRDTGGSSSAFRGFTPLHLERPPQDGVDPEKNDRRQRAQPAATKKISAFSVRYIRRGLQLVHVDECGFAPSVTRPYGYAPKGQRVDGLMSGHRRPRTSQIAARIGPAFAEPVLFEGTCDAEVFNAWLNARLCPRLTPGHHGQCGLSQIPGNGGAHPAHRCHAALFATVFPRSQPHRTQLCRAQETPGISGNHVDRSECQGLSMIIGLAIDREMSR